MQRSYLFLVAVMIAFGIAGFWWFTQSTAAPPSSSPDDSEQSTPSAPDPETGSAVAAERTLVAEQSRDVSAVANTRVLRVILEGIPEEDASKATVKVFAVDSRTGSTADLRPTWPCKGLTTEFDLDPFLARAAERHEKMRFDELGLEIDHPDRLREKIWFLLSTGVQQSNGLIVHEVRERLVRPDFWPALTLTVRDAQTRAHLHNVELWCVPTHFMNLRQQPGTGRPYSEIAGGLSSPIALLGGRAPDDGAHVAGVALGTVGAESFVEIADRVATKRGVLVYARAPGYAWGRIVLDFSKSTERELLLGPAATLDVRLRNVQLERYSALGREATLTVSRLGPNGSVSYVRFVQLDETLATEGLQLEGLEPGDYAVTVQLGGEWSHKKSQVLAREELTLAAFESRKLVLVVDNPPAPAVRATLGGLVSFPEFGDEDEVRLQLFEVATYKWGAAEVDLALSDMERVDGALRTWSFHAEDLPVGRYQAHLLPFLTNWMVDVPAGGREGVRFVIPNLAEVLVETVDAETGERIPLEVLRYYHLERVPGQVHHSWKKASVDEPGLFRFWTAPGAAKVGTLHIPDGLGYGMRQYHDLDLVAGFQSVRFELERVCNIRFELLVDGAPLPRVDEFFVGVSQGIRAVGHDGDVISNKIATEGIVEVSGPGAYEVSFEGAGADRFHPIEPRRVEVHAGKTAQVVVELRRK